MLEAAADALVNLIAVERLLFMLLGITVGLLVGIVPGLGGTAGMAILLPFIWGMDPTSGVALLLGMAAVVHTSDTFPSVLLGVPGSAGSQATIVDGYPLARRGEAGRALGASFIASMVGGLIGAVVIFSILTVARPLVLALGSPELFMLAVLGLSMVGVLSVGSPLSGLLAGVLGLLAGAVGLAPAVAQPRFTFGSLYLMDGIPLPVVALALFAIPELVDLLIKGESISQSEELKGGMWDGLRDAWRHRLLVVRSAVMGSAIGIVPGLGGAVVDWIVYGVTKRTSRDPEEFGSGDIRGVIGPESANNAKEGGALVPTLLFGIPGSGTSAMLLGGLILMGIQVGPPMLTRHLDITLTVIWTLCLANIVATALCFSVSRGVARISLIPAASLAPFIIAIVAVAAYQSTQHWGDLVALVGAGALGWLMKRLEWPRAPLLVGFILAVPMERYLHLSMSRYELDWLTRPGVVIIGLLVLGAVFGGRSRGLKTVSSLSREEE